MKETGHTEKVCGSNDILYPNLKEYCKEKLLNEFLEYTASCGFLNNEPCVTDLNECKIANCLILEDDYKITCNNSFVIYSTVLQFCTANANENFE